MEDTFVSLTKAFEIVIDSVNTVFENLKNHAGVEASREFNEMLIENPDFQNYTLFFGTELKVIFDNSKSTFLSFVLKRESCRRHFIDGGVWTDHWVFAEACLHVGVIKQTVNNKYIIYLLQ